MSTSSPWALAALALGVLGLVLVVAGVVALFRLKLMKFAFRTLIGLLLIAVGGLAGAVAIGTQGYRALTREDVAGRIVVQPTAPQRFTATLRYPDGREATYDIAGDEIYLDAYILKWTPLANFVGLHTAYELGRVGGRYREIGQERYSPRTIYALGPERPIDLFDLRRRYAFLAPLYDAQYGSATFVPVTGRAELELRVSTTGLLMREAKP